LPLDPTEPLLIADAVAELGLRYAVITSVTRDDLSDGGAAHFALSVKAIKEKAPDCFIELLIPDFLHSESGSLDTVVNSAPDRINHNIEVVPSLFKTLRPLGDYTHSLRLIRRINESGIPAKSGLMIGFGETYDEIRGVLDDLISAGCMSVTVGQYLRSKKDGFPVSRYYHPDEFSQLHEYAVSLGFTEVLCTPLARSSYHVNKADKGNQGSQV
jgi:lipoic acid synthetase